MSTDTEKAVGAVTDADFTELVLWSEKPVVVEFWAPWCGPCRMVAPILEQIAADHPDRITVVAMNADENPRTTSDKQVLALPTIHLYHQGRLVKQIYGARPKAFILHELADYLT